MQDFHQLNVWRKAHTLVLRVYKASKDLPPSETMGLAAHLRRSAVTIPRTIAEGTGRASDFEFANDLKNPEPPRTNSNTFCCSAAISALSRNPCTTSCFRKCSKCVA